MERNYRRPTRHTAIFFLGVLVGMPIKIFINSIPDWVTDNLKKIISTVIGSIKD
jgi:hypothetical protein